jgi:hypothetical protein
MATRMQQRRGTAAQWTSTNAGAGPVLNAGEIGWESDTNRFKIGDGVNNWSNLDYFADINSTVNPAFGSSITFEGATANNFETTLSVTDPTADRTITFPDATGTVVLSDGSGNVTVSGDLTVTGTTTTINSTTINATTGIVFEGATTNDFETTLTVTDPTADRTITFPDATGTVVLRDSTDTLTNKSISLGSNTVTSTLAQLNTAVTDADVASLAGTETLTNKTLTSPIVSGLTLSDGSIIVEGTTADNFETTLIFTDPTADRTITFPDSDGTVALAGDVSTSLSAYVLLEDIGADSGVAGLDGSKNLLVPGASIIIEGTTDNTFETTLTVTDPTEDRTITFPNASGTVALTTDIAAGTVTETGTQTLTNKTLTSPVVSGLTLSDSGIVIEGSSADAHETTLTVTNPTADRTITFPDATGTVALTTDITASNLANDSITAVKLAGDAVTTSKIQNLAVETGKINDLAVTTGKIAEGAVTSGKIADGTIVDGDINAAAAIAQSKISGLTTDLGLKAPLADPTFTVTSGLSIPNLQNTSASNVGSDFRFTYAGNPSAFIGAVTGTRENPQTVTVSGVTGTNSSINGPQQFFTESANYWFKNVNFTGNDLDNLTIWFPGIVITIPSQKTISSTELSYLDGVTSAIQTQMDAKAPLASPALTGTATAVNLTVSGDLTVNGTTTNINSTNLVVEDKNIVLADVADPSDATADGGGITLKGLTDKTFNWVDATDAWTSSEHINLASGKTLKYNGTDLVAAQSGNSGKYLTTDGTSTSWGTVEGYSAPTLGSTSIASGATVTTVTGLTLSGATLTGTLTAGGGTGTSGQVLASTGSGTQWTTISAGPTINPMFMIGGV